MTTEQATTTTDDIEVEDVQPVSEEDLFDNVADGLFDETTEEDQPTEEVEEEEIDDKPKVDIVDVEKLIAGKKFKTKIDGIEEEVDFETLRAGYQTNRHNTQAAQQLADERRQLAPIFGLAKKLQEDKEFQQHVFSYGKKQEDSDDPIQQIENNAVRKAEESINKRFESQRAIDHQARLDSVKNDLSKDPDFSKVQPLMLDHVNSFPEHLQEPEYRRLDLDPVYFLKVFNEKKESIKPKKKELEKIKPPVLVGAGITEDDTLKSLKHKKLDKKKAKVLATGDLTALEEWISSDGGLVDSLGL